MTLARNGSGAITAPTPRATRQIAPLAPITSPSAIPGDPLSEATTTVASSSGSAPASNNASAKALTPSRAEAAPRCSAKASAPHTMSATPAPNATSHRRVTRLTGSKHPLDKEAPRRRRECVLRRRYRELGGAQADRLGDHGVDARRGLAERPRRVRGLEEMREEQRRREVACPVGDHRQATRAH